MGKFSAPKTIITQTANIRCENASRIGENPSKDSRGSVPIISNEAQILLHGYIGSEA